MLQTEAHNQNTIDYIRCLVLFLEFDFHYNIGLVICIVDETCEIEWVPSMSDIKVIPINFNDMLILFLLLPFDNNRHVIETFYCYYHFISFCDRGFVYQCCQCGIFMPDFAILKFLGYFLDYKNLLFAFWNLFLLFGFKSCQWNKEHLLFVLQDYLEI